MERFMQVLTFQLQVLHATLMIEYFLLTKCFMGFQGSKADCLNKVCLH